MIQALTSLAEKFCQATSGYQLALAKTPDEVRLAQHLRFKVFNLELKEGLESAYKTGLDQDRFDECCDHLLVIHEPTSEVVGTYRMQTGSVAALHHGYYSAQEFHFAPYEAIRHQIIELGRACIHHDHRNFAVLTLLWRGISVYAEDRKARFLIGCSSLTSQDPASGAALYRYLSRNFLAESKWLTNPLPPFLCPLDRYNEKDEKPPKLLAAYLGLGAKICGPPAIDREFKTIDFLTMLDLQALSPQYKMRFSRPPG